jgi:tripartite-type tricarboxylate transporter receptor subunit TctC
MHEFVAYGRANPGKLAFGSGGNGTRINFATQNLLARLGIKAVHVPYKGEAPALADLVSGQLNMMMPPAGSAKGLVASGKLVALGTDGAKRWDQLPDVPTIAEAGIPELKDHPITRAWFGYAAAAGIPAEAAAVLQNALVTALQTAEIRDSFAASGFEVVASTPPEFLAAIAAELERNRKVIESGAITVE